MKECPSRDVCGGSQRESTPPGPQRGRGEGGAPTAEVTLNQNSQIKFCYPKSKPYIFFLEISGTQVRLSIWITLHIKELVCLSFPGYAPPAFKTQFFVFKKCKQKNVIMFDKKESSPYNICCKMRVFYTKFSRQEHGTRGRVATYKPLGWFEKNVKLLE